MEYTSELQFFDQPQRSGTLSPDFHLSAPGQLLPPNNKMEEISYAYLHAVAAICGFGCVPTSHDFDSIDATISAKGQLDPASTIRSPRLDVQLKATTTVTINNQGFDYDLKIKNYDELRAENHAPRILMVLLLPASEASWVVHSENELVTRTCAYWTCLHGLPPCTNRRSRRVMFKRTNIMSPATLRRLMTDISINPNEKKLCDNV